jgi:hypothetical protein
MLQELAGNLNGYTDKGTTHSYLELYNQLLFKIRDTALNVLEVGIGNWDTKNNGASILLWLKFFKKSNIYAIDIIKEKYVIPEIINNDRIKLFCSTNAYDLNFVQKELSGIEFDFMLDDGPHTLQSQKDFIKLYSSLLSSKGVLIIEDVQNILDFNELTDCTPEYLKRYIRTYDRRDQKGRYDDLVFTIDRLNS